MASTTALPTDPLASIQADCPPGFVVTGGGCEITPTASGWKIIVTQPVAATSWLCTAEPELALSTDPLEITLTATVVCGQ